MKQILNSTEAAKELHIAPSNFRGLMQDGTLSHLGYWVKHKKKTTFYVFRACLEEEKRKRGIE